MDKTSFKIFIMAIILSIAIFFGLLFVSFKINEHKKDQPVKLEYVTNPNIFFTVESCVNKYVQLLQNKNARAIYDIIDQDYKEEKAITIYNAVAINKAIDPNTIFEAEKILEDKNDLNTYYVLGYLTKNNIDDIYDQYRSTYSIIVKLDLNNYIYSVIPKDVEVIINAA